MHVIHFESINSTNKYLKENFETLENFTFVSTCFQTEGRGREDRVWVSHKNKNLLFSFLIKDKNLLSKFKALSIGVATLIARFLEMKGIKNISVKWPNDVYVNDKKICGILLEGDINKFLVVGVGLNVNQSIFDGDFRTTPTSIKLELNKELDLIELEIDLFEFIFKHINQKLFVSNTLKFVNSHNYLLNKKITINQVSGVVTGINSNFDLLVDNVACDSGEVILDK